ncbi:hypothetical protein N9268_02835 [Akkermansiaceae bacterium]|nr:hypothetical protein [Akkermansiaceae bacterium]MDA8876402.1 hypothetical protein [Akkermansiaceae bacterium]MDA8967543.1 hypothetical protein [Akkermansiaceae bacterium]MDB4421891.1 hypothetical protein [Akkermansiaceae bacterium]
MDSPVRGLRLTPVLGRPGVLGTGLSYAIFPANGGAISFPSGGNGRVGRLFATTYDETIDGVTVYLGILIELDSLSDSYRAFSCGLKSRSLADRQIVSMLKRPSLGGALRDPSSKSKLPELLLKISQKAKGHSHERGGNNQ